MKQKTEIKDVENKEEKIQDSLFYREIDYVLIIPENYTNDFLNGKDPKIEVKKTAEGYATYTEMIVNRYLKLAEIYNKAGMNQGEIVSSIKTDLEKEVNIIVENKEDSLNMNRLVLYYNFANYSFLAISIYLIAIVMSVFNKDIIKKKNNICKMPYKKISNQLFAGNIIFVFGIWLMYVLISLILCKDSIFNINGLLLMCNSLVFVIVTAAIGFLVSSLVKNKNAISGIVNVIALGLSFISGCFVPQEWINSNVVNFAKLFPSYWYIQNNQRIVELTKYTFLDLKPVLINMGIILLFGLIYVIINKIIIKLKH